jgi:hypothetical protein
MMAGLLILVATAGLAVAWGARRLHVLAVAPPEPARAPVRYQTRAWVGAAAVAVASAGVSFWVLAWELQQAALLLSAVAVSWAIWTVTCVGVDVDGNGVVRVRSGPGRWRLLESGCVQLRVKWVRGVLVPRASVYEERPDEPEPFRWHRLSAAAFTRADARRLEAALAAAGFRRADPSVERGIIELERSPHGS